MAVRRRMVLRGALGAGAAAVAVGTGIVGDLLPGGARLRRALGVTGPDGVVPDVPAGPVRVDRVRSRARGRVVELVTMAPAGEPASGAVCLALHGRGGGARWFESLGMSRFLTAAVRSGATPFTVVSVDCGQNYLLARDGDDPRRMITDELPVWLAERELPEPVAVLGISMGGFGALGLTPGPRTVAVISPALFPTWPDAKGRNVFRDEREWAASEPLRNLDRLDGTRLGVWCGTEDPFVEPARRLAGAVRPAVAAFANGAHDAGYWLRVLPDALAFVCRSNAR
jgi:putative esterase